MTSKQKKKYSKAHEDYIASVYGGTRSPSSGASVRDKGDVRVKSDETLFECKCTGSPGNVKNTGITAQMAKIADEAWAEGRWPALALRYWNPRSPLAGPDGWIDLTVRLTGEDATRGG